VSITTLNSRKSKFLGTTVFLIFIMILVAGLWPFNFWPENKVKWLKAQNGVQFFGQAIIYSQVLAPYSLLPLSVELGLQPITEEISHIGRIFSFLNEHGSETFFIGQWRSHLLLGKGIHGKDTYREMGIRGVLKKGEIRFVTITSGPDGTRIYVDANLQKSNLRFQLFSMNEKPSGKIVLGNSPATSEYWIGNLLSLAIYDRVLTGEEVSRHSRGLERSGEERPVSLYLFNEHSGTLAHDHIGGHHLIIPPRLEIFQKTILIPPWKDFSLSRSYLMDVLTNILGFIPFGFFFSAYLWLKNPGLTFRILLISVLLAGCISLSVEFIQVYLPTRSSQLMDVITNILGTAIGVALFVKSTVNRAA
jgi:hypothetical protein